MLMRSYKLNMDFDFIDEEAGNVIYPADENYIPAPDGYEDFFKYKEEDRVWWTSPIDMIGAVCFSFDRITVYNLWSDCPQKLTEEELKIFIEEHPGWAELKGLT